ncbi:unnamed protein product [Sphagnum jensenii]|uniref:TLC domain-containing protein n=1 Tax=Sphagnum jensenii TaxID=128206 RepID=A0ABP1BZ51_9BRYO
MVGSDHEVECIRDVNRLAEEALANAWKRDFSGLFFASILVLWFGFLLISIIIFGHIELWPIIWGLVFFNICNKVFNLFVTSSCSSLFQGLAHESRHDFSNIAISLMHSTIISLAAREARVFGLKKMSLHEVLYSKPWPGAHIIVGISCGYFAYDQWDMLRKHLYNPRSPSRFIHHVIFLICFTLAIYYNNCINYVTLTLVCEVHNVILQLRKVRKLLSTKQTRHSWGNSMMWFLNWMTYLTTRLAFHLCITMKLFYNAPKFPQGFEWSMKFMGMLSLNVFNLNLGKNLWKIYRKERVCVRLQQ